jgi:hypothetical protein
MPRRHSRRTVRHRRHHRKQEGGGWSEVLSAKTMINPGNPVHQPYPGPGKDCAGTPTRPGTLTDIGDLRVPGGLPGVSSMAGVNSAPVVAGPAGLVNTQYGPSWLFKGGGRKGRKGHKGKKQQGGATQLGSGGNVTNVKTPMMTNMSEVQSAMKASNPAPVPMGPNPSGYPVFPKQSGGRYGFFPSDGPLNPVNGVGATGPAPFYRIPCERGTFDALNPMGKGPMAQDYTTLPFSLSNPPPPGLTPMRSSYTGGGRTRRQKGGVYVGQVDAMRYYAPTAGYDNLPMKPMVQNNPGILMQVGYPARHMNMACLKTSGGGRKRTQRRRAPRKSRKQQQRKH